jgi:hypothetical protein
MTRSRRILAVIAASFSLLVSVGTLGSAGGCSGEGPLPPTGRDEAGDKVAQEKMRAFMQQKKTAKGTPQRTVPKPTR